MVITQNDLLARRREQVYLLHWKGKSSREIAAELGVSFKTVCLDIEYLTEAANREIRKQRKQIVLEYKETIDIFRYLLTKALEQFDKAEKDGNQDMMERLYPIIESLNANLAHIRNTGDLVEKELDLVKRQAGKLEEVIILNNDQTSRDLSQEKFGAKSEAVRDCCR